MLTRATGRDLRHSGSSASFTRELSPILSPIALDPAHPFPQVLNKGLNFIVTLQGKDAFGRNSGRSIVQAPRSLARIVELPESVAEHPHEFVLLSSIIEAHASDLFAGMTATGCYRVSHHTQQRSVC